ncbi:diguanylate cyclase [Oleiphilus sp. HI0071]|jgi:diguanylate cyclase (GGDEF)-like protein|uniref:GGDEF domain-containing protein n=1 Tax=unclassified Oleiphilus TaxID=2631174 RepID=UPI0007C2CA44|nr:MULTISPECIES: GGDEF domain-containing protein [unclassified Oleiphilus]KZY61108.1 diguanylate cyclase [Oleiphilus sp. HI0065]KZY90230.1 diguanylate cyclase [Oleiphilus sp. HI0071]KZY91969.1 diguanylate cyclase [Oleiphilus sp. HI0073]KZZ46488.1 diguanylate cyclase [Oleiphilus sp. HI0118]KZZ48847.1 diguanylate cyclase [Oleiphilus sp. HI0122]KZZ77851.1 diguanylate cyclase [Oleiphilus sp. HI0133]
MDAALEQMKEFHWLLDMLQTVDVGLVVIDQEFNVKVWNSFMESHSGVSSDLIRDKNLFKQFEDLPEGWLRQKASTVFALKNRSFITWEQRPYLFKFPNYRPITGTEEFMYQNITISPLLSLDGSVNQAVIIIYDVTDIVANRKALEKVNGELEQLSRTDRLTQLFNRGYWEECLIREYERFTRYKTECSVVMLDIDHFKKVNDTYGHPAGDAVIKRVAELVRDNLRKTDIAGRYGGEEFSVILQNTDDASAVYFCERLRKSVEKCTVMHDGNEIRFTISLGISQADPELVNYKAWLEQADQALYASKEGGRNQTWVYAKD